MSPSDLLRQKIPPCSSLPIKRWLQLQSFQTEINCRIFYQTKGKMKLLRKIRKYFKGKQEVPTEKRGPTEGEDSKIVETASQIEGITEENEGSNISNIDRYQYRGKQYLHPPLIKRRSSESDLLAQRKREHQEQRKQNFDETTSRSRAQTISCNSYFIKDRTNDSCFMNDPRLTENAKDLSAEQMLALELDILKPLDFFEILFNRIKEKDNGEALVEEETFNSVFHLS